MCFTRTLTAFIHSAFSRVHNVLHSLRTVGLMQACFVYPPGEPVATTDEMTARETKRTLWTSMAEQEIATIMDGGPGLYIARLGNAWIPK
jgi:hypothetical protein